MSIRKILTLILMPLVVAISAAGGFAGAVTTMSPRTKVEYRTPDAAVRYAAEFNAVMQMGVGYGIQLVRTPQINTITHEGHEYIVNLTLVPDMGLHSRGEQWSERLDDQSLRMTDFRPFNMNA